MIKDCANAIRRRGHDGKRARQVSEHWARLYLERHPEYLARKQNVQRVDRNEEQDTDVILEWLQKYKVFATKYGTPPTIYIASTGRDSVLESDVTS